MKKNYLSKYNKLNPITLLFAVLLSSGLTQAQESANASGGDAIGSNGSVAYSIGQVFYTTSVSGTGSLAQGVQHAYEIFTVGIKDEEQSVSLTVFPNPTTENLTLQIINYNNEKLSYEVSDMQGKLLIKAQILTQFTLISMNNLPLGNYFVNVVNQKNKKVQSFKIIKT